ncbi:MAG: hypothetical protein WBA97_04135 [Actinophytocola sp.]|uniref:hypothetical protein n=1 Tax=Actinophytocola sp. TaxID=1872138 RepID=UPI003C738C4E
MELVKTAPPRLDAMADDMDADHRGELHGSVLGRQVWRINCGDVVNRERCLTVLVERNRVVLVGPPGETAVLTSGQLGQLRSALREAAEQAER